MLMKIAPSLESNFCKRRNRGYIMQRVMNTDGISLEVPVEDDIKLEAAEASASLRCPERGMAEDGQYVLYLASIFLHGSKIRTINVLGHDNAKANPVDQH